jgi:glycosyltransferase involved in cell wall biosynthesis
VRFCLPTTFYPPWNFGGDGIQVQRLARALARRGHEVTVLHSREGYRAMGGAEHAAPPAGDGVRVVAIDAELGTASPLATYLTGRPLLVGKQLEEALDEPFDVVHFHNPSLLGGPAALRLGRGLKLYTAHEQWLVCPTHFLWQDSRRVCTRPHCWRCTVRQGRPPQPWRSTRLVEESLRCLDLLIAPSATSAALHARFRDIVQIACLGHFVPDPGEPAAGEHQPQTPYVLFAGRLEPIKGPQTLLAAFRRWSGARLVVAGTGALEQDLREQAADLPHVEFVGWHSGPDLDRLFRRALVAVAPSVGHESFGLVPVEALARGVPAIVRDFGALGELAQQSEAIIGYGSDDEFIGEADALVRSPERRAALAAAGRRDYLARWAEAPHMRGYFSLIADRARARGLDDLEAAASAARDGEQVAA